MGKFFKWFFLGALIGVGAGLAFYALGFVVELLNCACGIITCNCDRSDALPFMWGGSAFQNTMIFCTIGGWIIGSIYGATLGIQERNERLAAEQAERDKNALAQRQKNASLLQSRAESTIGVARNIKKNSDSYSLSPTYISSDKQKKVWECINEAIGTNEKLREIIATLEFNSNNKEE